MGSGHPRQISQWVWGRRSLALLSCIGLLLVSCGPTVRPGGAQSSGSQATGPPAVPKTLRIGMIAGEEPTAGIALFGEGGTGALEFTYAYHAGLTVLDPQGNLVPHLAQKIPRLDEADWQAFPDGRMEVTWKLRRDVRWHDGTPLTAQDFVFGVRLLQDDQLPIDRGPVAKLISQAVAPDTQTLVLTWKQPYILANASGPTDIPAVPRHLLADLYESADRAGVH